MKKYPVKRSFWEPGKGSVSQGSTVELPELRARKLISLGIVGSALSSVQTPKAPNVEEKLSNDALSNNIDQETVVSNMASVIGELEGVVEALNKENDALKAQDNPAFDSLVKKLEEAKSIGAVREILKTIEDAGK